MAPLTEFFAAVVAHSSVVALSHFGVVVEPPKVAPPAAERVIARSPRKDAEKLVDCPDAHRPQRSPAQKV